MITVRDPRVTEEFRAELSGGPVGLWHPSREHAVQEGLSMSEEMLESALAFTEGQVMFNIESRFVVKR